MNIPSAARTRSTLLAGLAAVALLALLSLGSPPPVAADVANTGFESGDLTGWTTTGNVEVLQGSAFAPAFAEVGLSARTTVARAKGRPVFWRDSALSR